MSQNTSDILPVGSTMQDATTINCIPVFLSTAHVLRFLIFPP